MATQIRKSTALRAKQLHVNVHNLTGLPEMLIN